MTCILEVLTTQCHVDCILWPGPTIIVAVIKLSQLNQEPQEMLVDRAKIGSLAPICPPLNDSLRQFKSREKGLAKQAVQIFKLDTIKF
jgi:hypothetical protein